MNSECFLGKKVGFFIWVLEGHKIMGLARKLVFMGNLKKAEMLVKWVADPEPDNPESKLWIPAFRERGFEVWSPELKFLSHRRL